MKRTFLTLAALASLAGTFAPAAQAQNDEWNRWWQERQARREIRQTDRDMELNRRIAERERAVGIERPHATIDTRTQTLGAAPRGYEWQTAPNGDYLLVTKGSGVVVQVVRNTTPAAPVAP